jgi:pimeloyl-ACP methyl ester carboxylesterase
MGGYICLEILRQAPNRVARLALLDTSAPPHPELTGGAGADGAGPQRRFAWSPTNSSTADHPAPPPRPSRPRAGTPDFPGTGPGRHPPAAGDHGPADSAPGSAIGCPILVLVGDADRLTPPELSAEIADGNPGAQLIVVAGSGHLTPLDQPEQVTKALVEGLQA